MECNSLYQVIKEPTRVTSHSAMLLDLIITNYPGYFVFSDVLSPPSGCDHSFVYARINVFPEKQKCYKRRIWDFSKIDYTVLHTNLLKKLINNSGQNTKKNHKRVVVLYVIKNHVNLHKL